MTHTVRQILDQIEAREDSRWEFKELRFAGTKLKGPGRSVLADEMAAFANARGGTILCGVTDDGRVQDLTGDQAAALDALLVEVATDSIDPPLRIETHHRRLPVGRLVVAVVVPKGDAHYRSPGGSFIRVGGTKRRMTTEEQLRLAQRRAQARYLWFDQQPVPGTGLGTLNERLWTPLLSATGAKDPRRALSSLRLLMPDGADVYRATVAGVLLCADSPQEWLPQAVVMATHYRGRDRASGQLDARIIEGPLPLQVGEAVKFVVRSMRVAARKTPARVDMPQYSDKAIFEAVVNAVVHRDYSIRSRRIRLSLFRDRLEVESPGQLANGMTLDGMDSGQATRNEVLASVFGRIPVGGVPGSDHRRYLMERRGDGVSVIKEETRETAGTPPEYRILDESDVLLTIPAAKLEVTPSEATVAVHSQGEPLVGADVLALFPNKTWRRATTDHAGNAEFDLHTSHLPMTVYAAAPGFAAGLARDWIPRDGGLVLEVAPLAAGGAVIFPNSTGDIPGLRGRLNPIRDTSDRTYLYADNVAIEEGRQQPVPFRFGTPLRLTDAFGVEMTVSIVDILGRAALVEYRSLARGVES